MAAALTVVTKTTNNTALGSTGINTSAGWATNDVAVVVITTADTSGVSVDLTFTTASGGTATEDQANATTTRHINGSDIAWSVAGLGGNGRFVWVGTFRLDTVGTSGLTVATAYGAASGRKRTYLLRYTPDSADAPVPTRANRDAATGSGSGTTTAGFKTFTLGAIGDTSRKIVTILGYTTSAATTAAEDWNNNAADDTTSGYTVASDTTQADEGVLARLIPSGDSLYPGTTVAIHYNSNPGASGWAQAALVFYGAKLPPDAATIAEVLPKLGETLTMRIPAYVTEHETLPRLTESLHATAASAVTHLTIAESIPRIREAITGTATDHLSSTTTLPHLTEQFSIQSSTGEALEILPRLTSALVLEDAAGNTIHETLPRLRENPNVVAHIPAHLTLTEILPNFAEAWSGGQFRAPAVATVTVDGQWTATVEVDPA